MGGINLPFMTGCVLCVNNALNIAKISRSSDMGQQEFQRRSLEVVNRQREAVNEVLESCETIVDLARIFDTKHRTAMANTYIALYHGLMTFRINVKGFNVTWRGLFREPAHVFEWVPRTYIPHRLHPNGVLHGEG